ncbi:MAG: hypothetical protein DRG40_05875 [Deltaproteobacteria bacterium]|nr:MAG: hypothetical protein DRG40_05875 [Deltaproteobacteria bacterium]
MLAVGDAEFQEKCYRRIKEMRQEGVTIVYVSHNLNSVVDICDRALWLDEGEVRMEGDPEEVVKSYLNTP